MDIFNLTDKEKQSLMKFKKRLSSKTKASLFAYDDSNKLQFVGRRCFYFQEYCIFPKALQYAPKRDAIPKNLVGVEFAESNVDKKNGVLEMCIVGSRYYSEDKKLHDSRRKELAIKAELLKEKYKNHNSAIFIKKKEALAKEYEDYMQEWKTRERTKPLNWKNLAHFETIQEAYDFLIKIGYKPKY